MIPLLYGIQNNLSIGEIRQKNKESDCIRQSDSLYMEGENERDQSAFLAAFFFFLIWLLTTLNTAVPRIRIRMTKLTGRVTKIM